MEPPYWPGSVNANSPPRVLPIAKPRLVANLVDAPAGRPRRRASRARPACALLIAALSSAVPAAAVPLFDAAGGGAGLAERIARQARALPPAPLAPSWSLPADFARRMVWDAGFLLTAPARFDGGDWLRFSVTAGLGGGLFAADRPVDVFSRERHPRSSGERRFEDAAQELGDAPGIAGVVGGSALFGWVTGNRFAQSLAADAGEAVALSGGLTAIAKEAIGRSRPRARRGAFRFEPFSGNASLPSGHVTAAFSLASAVSERFDDDLRFAVPLYGLASLVAFSRVRADAHFASDVFFGAAIGTVVGRTVTALEKRRERNAAPAAVAGGMALVPAVAPGFLGIELRARF